MSLALYRKYRPGQLRRGEGPGPRHRAAAPGADQRPHQPRLPVQRAARLRQDLQRPDHGALAQLRAGPDAGPLRHLRLVRGAGAERPRLARRHRDRRGVAQRRRRRPRPAGAGLLRPGLQPLQGLHHRRGPHGHDGGVQRAAEARRGAAGLREVRLRDDRARERPADHPLAHPPLPLPADVAEGADRAADLRRGVRGHRRRQHRHPAGRTRGSRQRARRPVDPGPGAGLGRARRA